ncbi:type III pantothenate kinase [Thermocrinis sp.]|uniref:type III pantothenate kinase n=1 Tax=Thermocrinis sp. TaxID=2024383 RepID=UPI002FDE4418
MGFFEQPLQTILTLDIGNTSVDACTFDGKELKYLGKFAHEELDKLLLAYDQILACSVKPSLNYKLNNAHIFTPQEVPIKTAFVGKEKVGIDRLLNLYGALEFYSESCLLISCGTALVVDLLVDGVFKGGFISLGLGTRLRCLSEKAELIPLFRLEDLDVPLGKDTKSAILGGLKKEVFYYIEGLLKELGASYKRNFTVIITGGDGWFLKSFGIYDPLLVHKAMLRLRKLL